MSYFIHVDKPIRRHYPPIVKLATSYGLKYRHVCNNWTISQIANAIKNDASLVMIMNGMHGLTPLVRTLCEARQIPHFFTEFGLLPQATTFTVDPCGICGYSILMHDLSWITDEDMTAMLELRASLQQQYPLQPQNHILVPLQLENDSQVLHFTGYNSMREMVDQVKQMYPKTRIVVRPHPKSLKNNKFDGVDFDYTRDFLESAAKASLVVGATSTTLYEAAILGVPIVALGKHPLSVQTDTEKVLAGITALRVQHDAGEMAAVLDRFNIHPISRGN